MQNRLTRCPSLDCTTRWFSLEVALGASVSRESSIGFAPCLLWIFLSVNHGSAAKMKSHKKLRIAAMRFKYTAVSPHTPSGFNRSHKKEIGRHSSQKVRRPDVTNSPSRTGGRMIVHRVFRPQAPNMRSKKKARAVFETQTATPTTVWPAFVRIITSDRCHGSGTSSRINPKP